MKKLLLLTALVAAVFAIEAQTQVPVLTEGFDGGGIPAGWTVIDADNDNETWTHSSAFPSPYFSVPTHNGSSGSVYSGSVDVQTYNPLTPDNWLITPEVTLTGNSTLTFWRSISDGYYPGDYYGVFITTASNPTTADFTQLFVETMTSADDTWGMRTVNLDNYAGQTVRIAFRHFNCTNGDILILDDVTVLTSASVPILTVSPSEVNFSNIAVGSVSSSQTVEVGAFNVTGTVDASVTYPFEISDDDLNFSTTASLPDTGGTLYVRYTPTTVATDTVIMTVAAGGITQSVTLVGNGIDCSFITLPFFDGFESTELNPCWTVVFNGTANLPVYGVQNEAASEGVQSFAMIPFYASTYDLYLITPELPLSGTKMVSFDHRGYYYTETFVVGYSTTTNDPDAFIWGETVLSTAADNPWNQYQNVTIPGNAKYIAIHHTSSDGLMLFIDNFTVSEVSSCMAPMNLSTSNITTTSADLSWYQSSDNLDITLYYMSSADTTIAEIPSVSLTDGVYSFENLIPGTSYYWMLGVICDNDTLFSEANSFITPCEAISLLPYTENFDSTAVGDIPTCWMQLNPYNGYPSVVNSHAHSGNALEFDGDTYTGTPVLAVMPAFTQDLSNLQVSFWTRREGTSSGTFSVGYVTDITDASTFVEITSYTAAQMGDNNYHFFNVLFNDVTTEPGTDYYIAFKYETSNIWFWYLDDVTVDEIPACIAPQDLVATTVTSSTATLNWTGNANSYTVYYRASVNASWDSVSQVVPGASGYTIEGLSANTTYQWYVVAECTDAQVTSLATATFTTDCGIFAAPFTEDFATSLLPTCWTRHTGLADSVFSGATLSQTSSGWVFNNGNTFGSGHAVLNIYGELRNHWLVSPAIDLNGLSDPMLTFDLALTDYDNANPIENPNDQTDDRFMVLLSIDDGATWSASNAIVWSNNGLGDYSFNQIASTGQTVNIPLTNYAGETVRIAFYGESTVSNGDNDLHIDNVIIGETPQCMPPSMLTATAITTTTATLSWTENGTANTWSVEYGPTGFTLGDGTTLTVDDTVPTFTLTGLTDNTTYDVYVNAVCNSNLSSDAVSTSFTTMLAPVSIPYSTDFSPTGDRNWQLNNGDCQNHWMIGAYSTNSGALFVTNNGTTPGYTVSNASSVVSAVKKLTVGTAEEILISFDILCGGEGQYDFIKLFLSPDSVAYPAANTTFDYAAASASYSTHAFDFSEYLPFSTYQLLPFKFNLTDSNTVHVNAVMPNPYISPDAASVANLVFLWRNDFMGGTQPGAIITNVSVTAVSCHAPETLTIGTVTDTSAIVSWQPGGDETAWNLEYKTVSDSTWTVVPVTTTVYTINGLTPETAYSVRVQANCGAGDFSAYVYETFTTDTAEVIPVVEPTVTTDAATAIAQTTTTLNATITNPDNVTITAKGFEWKTTNGGTYTQIAGTGTDNTYTADLTNLTPNTSYTFHAFITFNGQTVTGDEQTFTTLEQTVEPCETPTNLHASDFDTHSITIGWNANGNATSWNIHYRVENGDWNTANTTTNTYVISGLVAETTYEIEVQADCGGGNLSDWSAPIHISTAIDGIESWLENSVSLYPNPAKEVVNVQCTMNNVQIEAIEVYNVYGKIVRTDVETRRAASLQTGINVSGLANGMYFVRVTTEKGAVTKPFVKK